MSDVYDNLDWGIVREMFDDDVEEEIAEVLDEPLELLSRILNLLSDREDLTKAELTWGKEATQYVKETT
jgi:hypothetical protein